MYAQECHTSSESKREGLGSSWGLGWGFLAPGDEGVAGLGKLGDRHSAPLSDEVGHSSQFLWGYVDELAPVVNHTCGDMQVGGLSHLGPFPPGLRMPTRPLQLAQHPLCLLPAWPFPSKKTCQPGFLACPYQL